tara:strand:+ start:2341 stop:2967 length:627 start_codon:yes stop_codon:yes gene_type:complete
MVNANPIEVIFFDIGGVLLTIHPDVMISKISNLTNTPFKILKESFPEEEHDLYERGEITDLEWFQAYKKSFPNINSLTENEFWIAWSMLLGQETDVLDILIRLKEHYKVWLLSNTNSRHIINEVENNFAFPNLVDGKIYSFQVGSRKPEKKIYEVACEKANVEPCRSIFIDDLELNIVGANKIGMNGIHYINTNQLNNELKTHRLNYE